MLSKTLRLDEISEKLTKALCWVKPMQESILDMPEDARWSFGAYENGFDGLKMSSWLIFSQVSLFFFLGFLESKN